MQQVSLMQMKGLVPTSDNPFGVLGTLLRQGNHETGQKPSQSPIQGVGKALGKILGGKK